MGRVRTKNTKPELIVRKKLFALNLRYRVNVKELPGKPDIVFKSRKKVIFVNGCFWHQHTCKKGTLPKSNIAFWKDKLNGNVKRDKDNYLKLMNDNWQIRVLWECKITGTDFVELKDWVLGHKNQSTNLVQMATVE